MKTQSYLLLCKQYPVVMETMSYTCVPSFISMECLRLFVVQTILGCHGNYGNYVIRMCTKFHLNVCYRYQVWREVSQAICCCSIVMETCSCQGNDVICMCTYQVSSLYVLPLESLRSEEVILKQCAWGYLLLLNQANKPICKLTQTYLDRVHLFCGCWRHKKSQQTACIESHILTTTVASPCQTVRELLAGDRV